MPQARREPQSRQPPNPTPMTTNHPHIHPPSELVAQWAAEWRTAAWESPVQCQEHIARRAADWSADVERLACRDWLRTACGDPEIADMLYEARRPKPPTPKQQALARCNSTTDPDGTIRRALSTIPD